MFEKFTGTARLVVVLAQEEARTLKHNYIGTEHLLLGLIHESEGVAAKTLESLGIALDALRRQIEEIIGQGEHAPSGHIPFDPRAKKVLALSMREAEVLGDNYVGTEHLLLGLIREGAAVAAQVLVRGGADLDRTRSCILQIDRGPAVQEGPPGLRDARSANPPPAASGNAAEEGIFARLTDRARRVLVLAQEEARMLNHNYIGTEHLLLGLILEREGVAATALESLGVSLDAVRDQVVEIIGRGSQAPVGYFPLTPRAKKVLELSRRETLQLGHSHVGTAHLLLGLIREGEGVATVVLVELSVDLNRVRQQVIMILSGEIPLGADPLE